MAIVRKISNDVPYRYLGNNRYRNLITGVEGEVSEEIANKVFKINLDATYFCENYPQVELLIKKLGLKIEANDIPKNI